MALYEELRLMSRQALLDLIVTAGVDGAVIPDATPAQLARGIAQQCDANPAVAARVARARQRPDRVRVGVVAHAGELDAEAAAIVAHVRRHKAQVHEVIRVDPRDADAPERVARCRLCVVIVGAAVGGDDGYRVLDAVVGRDDVVAARRWPWDQAATADFAADLALASRFLGRVERTFGDQGAVDALRDPIARALDAVAPLPPGVSGAATSWERAYLRGKLGRWLLGRHAGLVQRNRGQQLVRASLYVPLQVERTVDRDELARMSSPQEPGEDEPRPRVALDAALCADDARVAVVTGDAGTGKTVLTEHLAAVLAVHHLAGDVEACHAPFVDAVRRASSLDLDALGGGAPLVRIPVVCEARELDVALRGAADGALERFGATRLGAPSADVFRAGLDAGRYLWVVDSLDEVPGSARRVAVLHALDELAARYPACRVVLTSRPGAHTGAELPPRFHPVPIAPLDDALRTAFIDRWCATHGYEETQRAGLAEAVAELGGRFAAGPGDRPIEDNPLLLTCAFLVFAEQGRLPDNTADLYKRMLDILCATRGALGAERQPGDRDGDAALERRASPQVRLGKAVAVAWALQSAHTTAMPRRKLADALVDDASLGLADVEQAEQMVGDLCAATAIFREDDEGTVVVRPWHRSFQEYLAARRLAEQDDTVEGLIARLTERRLLTNPAWRGALAFLVGALGQAGSAKAQAAVRELVRRSEDAPPKLAGRMLAIAAAGAAEYRAESFDGQRELLDRLGEAGLARFAKDGMSWGWQDRCELLDAIAFLGRDTRFPDPRQSAADWVWMAPWRGVIGGDEEAWNRLPAREVAVDGFYLRAHPVTVAEYAVFVHDAGHAPPPAWGRQQRTPARPVWAVDWHDARAFCAWATAAWRLPKAGVVELPTSTEWESVARRDGGAD